LNPYHAQLDNQQPLQYTATPYPIATDKNCEVCHLEKMDVSVHHDNMDHPFRGSAQWEKVSSQTKGQGSGK
jgi:hypothetical protein